MEQLPALPTVVENRAERRAKAKAREHCRALGHMACYVKMVGSYPYCTLCNVVIPGRF